MENPYFNIPDKNSPEFRKIYLALRLGMVNALYEEDTMSEKFETGKMTFGNGNPYDADYNSVSDFYINGD